MLNKKIWAALLSSGLMLTSSGMLYAKAAPVEEEVVAEEAAPAEEEGVAEEGAAEEGAAEEGAAEEGAAEEGAAEEGAAEEGAAEEGAAEEGAEEEGEYFEDPSGAEQAVLDAQKMALEEPEEGQEYESIRDELDAVRRENGWQLGWDPIKKRAISQGIATFKTRNPASQNFQIRRLMASKEAILMAKFELIRQMSMNMSAEDKLEIPGCDLAEKFKTKTERIKNKMLDQSAAMATLMKKIDKAEAAKLPKNTYLLDPKQIRDLIDAGIKKLDSSYDPASRDAEETKKLNELKAAYAKVKAEYDKLMEEASKANDVIKQKQSSAVECMAAMPLFGCTALYSAENWNNETGLYEFAVLMTWSHKLERTARAIATGKELKSKKPGDTTVNEWLDGPNLAGTIGPQRFTDKNGDLWFLGIAAADQTSKSPRKNRNNLGWAKLNAMATAVYCVYSDVEGQAQATTMLQATGSAMDEDSDDEQVASSFAQKMSQKFTNKTINGMVLLAEKILTHPLSGCEIAVVVYGINANAAKDALANETRNVMTKIESNRYQTVQRGRKAANKAAIKASENRAEDFQKGYRGQHKRIQKGLQKRAAKSGRRGAFVPRKRRKAAPKAAPKARGGMTRGIINTQDDF